MKLSVLVRGELLATLTYEGKEPIQKIGEDALEKYRQKTGKDENAYEVRKTRSGAILDPFDLIKQVLDDEDFVSVALACDQSSPVTGPAEGPYKDVEAPEFVLPGEVYMFLDGNSLSTSDLVRLGKGKFRIKLTADAEEKVRRARKVVDDIVKGKKIVYGITTGFGEFANVTIAPGELVELQENLIRSHACGVGHPLSPERTRMLLALRINILSKGHSGVTPKTLHQLIDAFNASCLPWVPYKGTVGACGDLAPMSHLALGMMGEGKMWSPETGWGDATKVLQHHKLKPIQLTAKEGLALINGAQLITTLSAEAVERASSIARQADVVAALTMEVLKGNPTEFDSDVHAARPHKGQIEVARRFRSVLPSKTHPSEIHDDHRKRVPFLPQDAYTIRCCPQVHGIVNDTIQFVRSTLTTEMNSATDNPLVFPDRDEIISAGNFHGEYPAKVADYLAIGVHELANISERRLERLMNPAYSNRSLPADHTPNEKMPAFLVSKGGLNSGFMIAHCTSAALVSENKVLCHPASVDSLSTSAGQEDHVSMGGFSARKALRVVEHVEQALAIELLAACQAMEFQNKRKTTPPLQKVYELVRTVAKPWDKDRYMAPDMDEVTKLLQEEKVWHAVKPYMDNYRSQEAVVSPGLSTRRKRVPAGGSGGPHQKMSKI